MSDHDPDHEARGTWGATIYPGSDAVRKRLQSCGLSVSKVEMYRGHRNVWEATTGSGKRWVRWTEDGGWTIAKVQPGRQRA